MELLEQNFVYKWVYYQGRVNMFGVTKNPLDMGV